MKITNQQQPTDPVYPFMHGKGSMAKEFNKRQEKLWKAGHFISKGDFVQAVTTVLLEILVDDYDERHKTKKGNIKGGQKAV